MNNLSVYSEIGRLKKVLLHEPGEELNNLTPKYLGELLFDDIPWLPLAKKEHQAFAKVFKDNGVEVVYLVDLVVESILNDKIKEEFIDQYIADSNVSSLTLKELLKQYLLSFKDKKELVLKCIAGIKKSEISDTKVTLTDFVNDSPFITNPMPNLYFTRDPFASIYNGISLNHMYSKTRRRETIFASFIFKYHPDYRDVKKYYDRFDEFNIEGGDIHILNKETLLIGVSERTSSQAIELISKRLLYEDKTTLKRVLAFSIPKERTFMHLDTIFTQVDDAKFTIHKGCYEVLNVYELTKDETRKGNKLKVNKLDGKLEDILERYIGKKVTLIPCGGDDLITSDREQWSDGSNCVCLSPGVVIAYERNDVTNKLLEENGIKVIKIPSSELSRGRGGPRCMSMPLIRE